MRYISPVPVYLILALSLSGDGVVLDLSFGVDLHRQGVGRLLLPAHLQRELGDVDLRERSSIPEVLQKTCTAELETQD